MGVNGSPIPVFDTDEQTYVLVTLPIHPEAFINIANKTNNQVNDITFKTLGDLIAFSNQAKVILNQTIHNKVGDVSSKTTN